MSLAPGSPPGSPAQSPAGSPAGPPAGFSAGSPAGSLVARTAGRDGRMRVLSVPGAGADGGADGGGDGGADGSLGPGGGGLTLAELRALAPAPGLTGARVALCVADPAALVRALFALDGRAEAILLVSYAQPAAVVAGLATAANCRVIVTDRDDLAEAATPARPVIAAATAVVAGGSEAPSAAPSAAESGAASAAPSEAGSGAGSGAAAPSGIAAGIASAAPSGAGSGIASAAPSGAGSGIASVAPSGAGSGPAGGADRVTEWLMTTSGTTGLPKIIAHTLATLARTVRAAESGGAESGGAGPVWGLLYDPTRFAGMQVTLQGLLGGGRLVAIDTQAALADQVAGLAAAGVTHLSATPTLWRRLLMAPGLRDLPLAQITLGGEIVHQDVLDALRQAFPAARITHIYASTEAGVGFAVNDGRAGFPAEFLDKAPGGVRMRLVDGILWLRPPGEESRPPSPTIEMDAEGFISSGDRLAEAAGRLVFLGRQNGTINVGGVKIHPETVERVIGELPGVRLARITSKPSPITGALLVAEVLADPGADRAALKSAIAARCRAALEREAVPAMIRFVETMEVNAAGKLTRTAPPPAAPPMPAGGPVPAGAPMPDGAPPPAAPPAPAGGPVPDGAPAASPPPEAPPEAPAPAPTDASEGAS